jgi:RNA polymerase sigma-70 factor (ECF subfamily)
MPEPALRHAIDECELFESARRNDREAIRLPIKQQNRRLYRIARSIVRDDFDAEDVL